MHLLTFKLFQTCMSSFCSVEAQKEGILKNVVHQQMVAIDFQKDGIKHNGSQWLPSLFDYPHTSK